MKLKFLSFADFVWFSKLIHSLKMYSQANLYLWLLYQAVQLSWDLPGKKSTSTSLAIHRDEAFPTTTSNSGPCAKLSSLGDYHCMFSYHLCCFDMCDILALITKWVSFSV